VNGEGDDAVARDLEFSFQGRTVGYFEESAYPKSGGRYRYVPYRGPGHYHLTQALLGGPARCAFTSEEGTVEFVVASLPEYGVVQIDALSPETGTRRS
jgi:hypothetical protein